MNNHNDVNVIIMMVKYHTNLYSY